MMKVLLFVLLLPSLAIGAIKGRIDSIMVGGNSIQSVSPDRSFSAGRYNRGSDSNAKNRGRGRWSGNGTSLSTGFMYSTQTNSNKWVANDFVCDVFWFQDIFDTLLDACIGTAASDTQYITRVEFVINVTVNSSGASGVRGKIQGPVLIRPIPSNRSCASDTTYSGSVAIPDSATSFSRLHGVSSGHAQNDTVTWRASPGLRDSNSVLGDVATQYELTDASGSNYVTRIELGKYSDSTGGLLKTGHAAPIIWNLSGAGVNRVSVDITPIFKTAMLACVSGSSTMRSQGFGILVNWVTSTSTGRDSLNASATNGRIALQALNTTKATSMNLKVVTSTDIDGFCANKMRDAGPFKSPWYKRAVSAYGTRRDIAEPGEARKRP